MDTRATIFTTECIALSKALEIAERQYENKTIIIMTDSESMVNGLKNIGMDTNPNPWLTRILWQLEGSNKKRRSNRGGGKEIKIAWVLTHVEIEGNEGADTLAKEMTELTPEEQIKVPLCDLYLATKEEAWEESNLKHIVERTYKGCKYFEESNTNVGRRSPLFDRIKDLSRHAINTLSRIRANHYNLAESLARKGYIESELCSCGNGKEDIDHVIWFCTRYDHLRASVMRNFAKKDIEYGENVIKIVNRKDINP